MDNKKRGRPVNPLAPQIIAAAMAGAKPAAIAEKFGCEKSTVDYQLAKARRAGCLVPKQPACPRDPRTFRITGLAQAGVAPREIAAQLGLRLDYVRTLISEARKAGAVIPMQKSGPRPSKWAVMAEQRAVAAHLETRIASLEAALDRAIGTIRALGKLAPVAAPHTPPTQPLSA